MKRIKDIAIAVCISPEVVIVLLCLFLYSGCQKFFPKDVEQFIIFGTTTFC